jgi:hypothetical protein
MRGVKMKFTKELVIKIITEQGIELYNSGTPLSVPSSLSPEEVMKTICKLAQLKDEIGLNDLMKSCDDRILKYMAIKVLAWSGEVDAVNFLISKYNADVGSAEEGYAWGGHFSLLEQRKVSAGMIAVRRLVGYALGGHVEKLNSCCQNIHSEYELHSIAKSYAEGGHLQNKEDALELITSTTNELLKELLINLFKAQISSSEFNSFLDESRILENLMKKQNIAYKDAVTLRGAIEESENNAAPSSLSALSIFKDVAYKQLSYYQIKALQCQPQITISMMLKWKSIENQLFSLCHVQLLNHLLSAKINLSPAMAMEEIQGLNAPQAEALFELYDAGLRGSHLRNWYAANKDKTFSDKCLENLLRLHFDNQIEPSAALDEVKGKATSNSAIARMIKGSAYR